MESAKMLSAALVRRRSALEIDALADVASALYAAPQIWRGLARFDPVLRQPVRLFADETLEAWVIGWFAGQVLGLHDHGESAGAIVVAQGRLHETTLGPRGPEHRWLERGLVRRVPRNVVHSVVNHDTR